MHLFGLNWQLQESEGYGAFENGGGGRDTTPNTFMVSTDNGKSLQKKQPMNGKKTGVRKKMHYCNRFSLVFDCWRTQQNCSLKGVFNKETDNEWKWTQKNGHKNILPPLSFKNATTIDITRTHIRIILNKARDCLSLPHSTAQRGCVNVGQEALWLTWGFPSKETQEHMWQVFWYKIYHFV